MRILVCMKPIPDPIAPLQIEESGVTSERWIFGPYDENALETALCYADASPGSRVTILTVSPTCPEELIRGALAAGADDAIWVEEAMHGHSPRQIGRGLAEVVAHAQADIVLGGIQSGEWDFGQVPMAIAAVLDWPFLPAVTVIQHDGEDWAVTCDVDGHPKRARCRGPWIGSVTSSGKNALRYPTMKSRIQAKRKPIQRWEGDPWPAPDTHVTVRPREEAGRQTEWVEAPTDEAKGLALASMLHERRWI